MRYKTLNDTLIAYHYRAGTGPVVVFANSLGSDQSIWDEVITHLGPHRAVLTYDLRGQGASDAADVPFSIQTLADDLIALLDHLDMRNVILCGVSIGGLIALAVAHTRPALLRGMLLSNTAPRIGTADRWGARIADVQAHGLSAIADQIMDVWFASDFKAKHPDAWSGHRAMLLHSNPAGYVHACTALRDADLSAQVVHITVPTTCITGDCDRSVPPDLTAKLAAQIAGAELVTLPGSGHLPCLDAPSQVGDAIAALIRRTAPLLDRFDTGMAVRRSVLGDAHVNKAEAAKTDFDLAFQTLITESAWGTVWASDAITWRERSMITLALLAALGNFEEIPMHVRATARTGATHTDVQEALQHVAIYAGVPRANHAMKLAKMTFSEMEETKDD